MAEGEAEARQLRLRVMLLEVSIYGLCSRGGWPSSDAKRLCETAERHALKLVEADRPKRRRGKHAG